jgi:predicted transposase/invertase (TIGR01784 family)
VANKEMDTVIKKVDDIIFNVSQNEEMLRLYRIREKALSDYTSGMNAAERRGIGIGKEEGIVIGRQEGIIIGEQKGLVIGEQKKTIDFVLNLQSNGFSIEDIAKFTKISSEEVRSIFKAQGLA